MVSIWFYTIKGDRINWFRWNLACKHRPPVFCSISNSPDCISCYWSCAHRTDLSQDLQMYKIWLKLFFTLQGDIPIKEKLGVGQYASCPASHAKFDSGSRRNWTAALILKQEPQTWIKLQIFGGFVPKGVTVYTNEAEIWHGKVYHGFTLECQFLGGDGWIWSSCLFCSGLAMLMVFSWSIIQD